MIMMEFSVGSDPVPSIRVPPTMAFTLFMGIDWACNVKMSMVVSVGRNFTYFFLLRFVICVFSFPSLNIRYSNIFSFIYGLIEHSFINNC